MNEELFTLVHHSHRIIQIVIEQVNELYTVAEIYPNKIIKATTSA
jgi:hypothetical protein